jgi:hypothetical protein
MIHDTPPQKDQPTPNHPTQYEMEKLPQGICAPKETSILLSLYHKTQQTKHQKTHHNILIKH